MLNRTTSIYTVVVDAENPNDSADHLIKNSPAVVTASGIYPGQAYVCFRAHSDTEALVYAELCSAGLGTEPIVRTGIGPSQREVSRVRS